MEQAFLQNKKEGLICLGHLIDGSLFFLMKYRLMDGFGDGIGDKVEGWEMGGVMGLVWFGLV